MHKYIFKTYGEPLATDNGTAQPIDTPAAPIVLGDSEPLWQEAFEHGVTQGLALRKNWDAMTGLWMQVLEQRIKTIESTLQMMQEEMIQHAAHFALTMVQSLFPTSAIHLCAQEVAALIQKSPQPPLCIRAHPDLCKELTRCFPQTHTLIPDNTYAPTDCTIEWDPSCGFAMNVTKTLKAFAHLVESAKPITQTPENDQTPPSLPNHKEQPKPQQCNQ